MSPELEIPRFGQLLQPLMVGFAREELPAFLAALERTAADRYRHWAEACDDPDEANGLLACAAREDEIAQRVSKLFPVGEAAADRIDARLPEARSAYYAVFESHPVRDQYRIQANAERQGAEAWRALAAQQTDAAVREELRACAELEEASAGWLEALLDR